MAEPTMGEMSRWTFYQRFIAEHVTDTDPRHVEAWMRVAHPTLDGLGPRRFGDEVEIAIALIDRAGTDQSEALARSFGL